MSFGLELIVVLFAHLFILLMLNYIKQNYVLFTGDQTKPVSTSEETKHPMGSTVLSTKTDISETNSLLGGKSKIIDSRQLPLSNSKNNHPTIFSTTDCAIIRPTPKHPVVGQEVTMSSEQSESSRRMSISKSTSSLPGGESSQRMTRSHSVAAVQQKTVSPLTKISEKRKLPQDIENSQKKLKSGLYSFI